MKARESGQLLLKTLRNSVPLLTLLVGILIGATPLGIPGLARFSPFYALAGLYFWTLHRPNLVPRSLVFGVGVVQDAAIGAPIGLSSAVLLLAQSFVLGQRMFLGRKTFWISWLGLAVTALAAGSAAWLIACSYQAAVLPLAPVMLQTLATILIYPALANLLAALQHRILAVP